MHSATIKKNSDTYLSMKSLHFLSYIYTAFVIILVASSTRIYREKGSLLFMV